MFKWVFLLLLEHGPAELDLESTTATTNIVKTKTVIEFSPLQVFGSVDTFVLHVLTISLRRFRSGANICGITCERSDRDEDHGSSARSNSDHFFSSSSCCCCLE